MIQLIVLMLYWPFRKKRPARFSDAAGFIEFVRAHGGECDDDWLNGDELEIADQAKRQGLVEFTPLGWGAPGIFSLPS